MADERTFTFDLHESLYFEKGQEVAEMRGIALEPEISIQPYEEYISIRGIIELQGEYERAYTAAEEEQPLDLENFYAKRYVERVYDEEGSSQFSHRFPVEISVPPYRVADLDAVKVTIESFDYEIVDPGHLKLSAKIGILGIDGEVEQQREEDGELPEEAYEYPLVDESFSFEISKKKEATPEVYLERNAYEEEVDDASSQAEEDGVDSEASQAASALREADDEELERYLEKAGIPESPEEVSQETGFRGQKEEEPIRSEGTAETENFDEVHEDEPDVSVASSPEDADDPDRWKIKSQSFSEFFHKKETVSTEESEEEYEIEVSEHASEPEAEERKEEVSFLSDIFRADKEERYTRLRLCIVQNQDTLDTVADRFSVSPLQIIKQNHLEENFEIHEGQLLYIPAK